MDALFDINLDLSLPSYGVAFTIECPLVAGAVLTVSDDSRGFFLTARKPYAFTNRSHL